MTFQKTYHRPDGYRVKIEPVLEIESFDNQTFTWSYIFYYAAPGQEKFEDVTTEHLEGQAYAIEQEILECQLQLWGLLKPGNDLLQMDIP